jgi:hypothetical protein
MGSGAVPPRLRDAAGLFGLLGLGGGKAALPLRFPLVVGTIAAS